MAEFIGEWAVKLSANATGLVSGLDDAAKKTGSFANTARAHASTLASGTNNIFANLTRINLSAQTQQFAGMANALANIGTAAASGGALAGISALTGLATAVISFANASVDAVNSQVKLGRQIGMTAQDAAGLQIIARGANIAPDAMSASLVQYAHRMEMLRQEMNTPGGGTISRALAAMNIDGRQFLAMNFGQQLAALADGSKRLPEGHERTAVLLDVVGNRARDMLGIFRESSSELRDMAGHAGRLGINLDQADAERISETSRNAQRTTAQLEARFNVVGTTAASAYENIASFGMEIFRKNDELVNWLTDYKPPTSSVPQQADVAVQAAESAAAAAALQQRYNSSQNMAGAMAEGVRLQRELNELQTVTSARDTSDVIKRLETENRLRIMNAGLTREQIQLRDLAKVSDNQADFEQLGFEQRAAAAAEMGASIRKQTEDLTMQAITIGMSADRARLFRAEMSGVGGQILTNLRAATEFNERMQQMNRMRQEGQRLAEQLQNPVESFQSRINDLARLQAEGAIGAETFGRGIGQAFDQLDRAFPDNGQKTVSAMVSGSVEAARAISAAQSEERHSQRDPMERVQRILEQQRQIAEQQQMSLARLVTAAESGFFDVLDE